MVTWTPPSTGSTARRGTRRGCATGRDRRGEADAVEPVVDHRRLDREQLEQAAGGATASGSRARSSSRTARPRPPRGRRGTTGGRRSPRRTRRSAPAARRSRTRGPPRRPGGAPRRSRDRSPSARRRRPRVAGARREQQHEVAVGQPALARRAVEPEQRVDAAHVARVVEVGGARSRRARARPRSASNIERFMCSGQRKATSVERRARALERAARGGDEVRQRPASRPPFIAPGRRRRGSGSRPGRRDAAARGTFTCSENEPSVIAWRRAARCGRRRATAARRPRRRRS